MVSGSWSKTASSNRGGLPNTYTKDELYVASQSSSRQIQLIQGLLQTPFIAGRYGIKVEGRGKIRPDLDNLHKGLNDAFCNKWICTDDREQAFESSMIIKNKEEVGIDIWIFGIINLDAFDEYKEKKSIDRLIKETYGR